MLPALRQLALLILLIGVSVNVIGVHAQGIPDTDDIPANCENTSSPYADANLFPRYANGQLALIDWSSGEVARVLEAEIAAPEFWFVGWSPDCHYLAGGLGDGERYTTFLWNATSGARMGTVEDAYRRPHFITWSPRSDSVVVETRHGAFLWDLATGTRLQLTIDSFNGGSFRRISWNYEAGTLETTNMRDLPIVYSIDTGRPLQYTLMGEQYIGSASGEHFGQLTVTAATESSPYGCEHGVYRDFGESSSLPDFDIRILESRLTIVDEITGDTLQVLDADFGQSPVGGNNVGFPSPNCDMYYAVQYMEREDFRRQVIVFRMSDGAHLHTIGNMPRRWSPDFPRVALLREQWDTSGRYLFAQSYDGAQVWDSATDHMFYVTSAEESRRYGYSVNAVTWDVANGRITADMLYSDEIRVFDLASGQRVE